MKYDIYSIGIMIAVISFLGFVLENSWLAVTKGFIDNRNMNLPFLFGYGLLVTGMYYTLGTPQDIMLLGKYPVTLTPLGNVLTYFFLCMVIVSLGEIALGYTVEKLCGFEYWNYTRLPMHITKYTSVPTSIGFAFLITLFMGYAFPAIMDIISTFGTDNIRSAAEVLVAAMAVDFIASFARMYKNRSLYVKWRIDLDDLKENMQLRNFRLK